ncbi:MAG TPA: hypothetical protein VF548_07205 [Allosphingosinicella sp.]|jgi:hypothetical protein
MRDEIDGRIWTQHHGDFSKDVATFFAAAAASIGEGFRRLTEIQFDAPWKHDVRGPGHA